MMHVSVAAARVLASVAMVLLWRADAWLLVGTGTAITFVLVRHRVVDHLWWRPVRVALCALDRACVDPERTAGSRAVVPDIVVEARGRTTVLDRAGDLLREGDDIRRWAMGAERLAVARCWITDTASFPLPRRRRRSEWMLPTWSALTGLAAILVASGGGGTAAIVYVAAFTATAATFTDLREERRSQPSLVACLAGDLPAGPRDRAAHAPAPERLAVTAATPSVTRRAIRILERSSLQPDQRRTALALLEETHRVLAHTGRAVTS